VLTALHYGSLLEFAFSLINWHMRKPEKSSTFYLKALIISKSQTTGLTLFLLILAGSSIYVFCFSTDIPPYI
jgi:hypothetical protein